MSEGNNDGLNALFTAQMAARQQQQQQQQANQHLFNQQQLQQQSFSQNLTPEHHFQRQQHLQNMMFSQQQQQQYQQSFSQSQIQQQQHTKAFYNGMQQFGQFMDLSATLPPNNTANSNNAHQNFAQHQEQQMNQFHIPHQEQQMNQYHIPPQAKRIKTEDETYQPTRPNPLFHNTSASASKKAKNDNADSNQSIDQIMDVTNYGGIDLKKEEEMMNRSTAVRYVDNGYVRGVDRIKVEDFINMRVLKDLVGEIAEDHELEVEDDTFTYLALAAQERLRTLIESMVITSKHRTGLIYDNILKHEQELQDEIQHPEDENIELSVIITNDTKKKLQEIEKTEREAEIALRKSKGYLISTERESDDEMEVDDNTTTLGELTLLSEAQQAEKLKQKKKKPTKKDLDNIPENVKKRLMNQAALKAVGGPIKDWMLPTGNVDDVTRIQPKNSRGKSKKKSMAKTNKPSLLQQKQVLVQQQAVLMSSMGERVVRPMTDTELRRVTVNDALYVLSGEKKHCFGLLNKWMK